MFKKKTPDPLRPLYQVSLVDELKRCLNCDASLEAGVHYCASCGQKVQPLKTTLRELLEDAWDATFGVDSKFLKTLWILFTRPGFLTAQYFAGKRVAYLRPVTLFLLFTGFLFLCLEWFGSNQGIKRIRFRGKEYSSVSILPGFDVTLESAQVEAIQDATDEEIRQIAEKMNEKHDLEPWQGKLVRRSMEVVRQDGMEALRHRVYAIGSRSVFILVPLMALIVKLLHFRRKLYFLDAVVYCMHLHCLLFSAFLLLVFCPGDWTRDLLAILLIPLVVWYTTRSLVVSFRNGYFLAFLKAGGLLLIQAFFVFLLTTSLILGSLLSS